MKPRRKQSYEAEEVFTTALDNEALFDLIRDGNDDLKPVLWERVKKLMYAYAGRYYRSYSSYCISCGVTEADLRQAAYQAFEQSFEGYRSDRGAYSNYLNLMFKQAVRSLFRRDPLNDCESLDKPISDGEGNETAPIELIEDTAAADAFEDIERRDVCRVVREQVAKLPDRERDMIEQHFFNGKTYEQIAAEKGFSLSHASGIGRAGIAKLRRNRELDRLADKYGYTGSRIYHDSLSGFRRSGISQVEAVALERVKITEEIEDIAREEMCRSGAGASFDDIIRSMQEGAVRKARSSFWKEPSALSVTKSHGFQ